MLIASVLDLTDGLGDNTGRLENGLGPMFGGRDCSELLFCSTLD